MNSRKRDDTRVGKQPPRFTFLLNPYSDVRFTKCPKCEGKTGQKTIPLVIHIKGLGPVSVNKTCRYCRRCDLLIAHRDEIEPIVAQRLKKPAAKLSKDDYLVLGTIDRADWKRGLPDGITPEELMKVLHDFKEVVTVKVTGGWVRETEQPKAKSSSTTVYQFKITLIGIKPPIWRRIQTKDCTLDKLHEHIQTAMGWTNSHLHQFEIGGVRYGDPQLLGEGGPDGEQPINSLRTNLSDILPKSSKRFRIYYEYDFGDGWEHEILFEGRHEAEKRTRYPRCIEGKRACPPEDMGGIYGYMDFLEALADPKHERHEEFLEWSGPFDPEQFDAKMATREMRKGLPNWREIE